MEHARKLALIDSRQLQYDHMYQRQEQHAEYKDIQKLPVLRTKTSLSLDMKRILDDDTVSDDVKAKLYRRALDRYLKVDNAVAESATESAGAINPLRLPHLQRQVSSSSDEGEKTKKKQKRKKTATKQQQDQQRQKKKKKSKITPLSPSPSPSRVMLRRSERLGRRWLAY